MSAADRWCGRHRRRILLGLVLAACVLRVAHFVEIERSPVVSHHHWDQVDMSTYHRWARIVAAGDWLTDVSFHPVHRWHRLVASSFFRQYPEQRASFGATGVDDTEAGARLWESWTGGPRFHAEPLYPYLGALTYRWVGADARWIYAWQSLLGVACLLLIHAVSRRVFGDLVATVAALLGLLCGPLLFYEMVLQRTTLLVFTGLLLVWLIQFSEAGVARRRWLVTGLAFGLSILVKSVFVVLFVALLGVRFWIHRKRSELLIRSLPMLVLGLSLGLAPLVARNLAVGAPPLALSSVNSTAFAMSNGAGYQPRLNQIELDEIASIMGRSEGRFLPTVVNTLRTHGDPLAYTGVVWRKFETTWHGFEIPNNASFYYHRLYSRTLRLLPVTFYLLSPLALVGLFLALPRMREAWPLYLLVGTHLLVMLIALVQSRYRMPLVVALLPFAALTLTRWVESLLARRWKPVAILTVVVALFGLWSSRAIPPGLEGVREGDCTTLVQWHRREHGMDALRQYLLTVLEVAPESLGARVTLGDVERQESNLAEAALHYETALELDPRNRYALRRLVQVYERLGRPALAETLRRRLTED